MTVEDFQVSYNIFFSLDNRQNKIHTKGRGIKLSDRVRNDPYSSITNTLPLYKGKQGQKSPQRLMLRAIFCYKPFIS